MMSLKVTPDNLDVIEFRRIFWQPLDDEPMGSLSERCRGRLADVDWAIVEHYDDRLDGHPRFGAIQAIERLQVCDEVGAALGTRGGDDELALAPIEGAHHGHFLGLPRRRHAQVRATLGPGPSQIRMGEGLTLVGEEKHNIAGRGLRLAQLKPQPDTIDGIGILTAL